MRAFPPGPPGPVLILGGTAEASAIAAALAAAHVPAILSYAGRVARPRAQPVRVRQGGFGGAQGLADYLTREGVARLVDATHPFAATISAHAVVAAARARVPMIALQRPPWHPVAGDDWTMVADTDAAAKTLGGAEERVFLAIGRQQVAAFAPYPDPFYLLRLVDAWAGEGEGPLPLPRAAIVIDRGPFALQGDMALLRAHAITRIVARNAGGAGAEAKLVAARALGLPVTMIARPTAPERPEVDSVAGVLDWLGCLHGAPRGV